MLFSAHGEAFTMKDAFPQLDGADIQCWELTISMSSLGFKILGLTSEPAYLFFGSPDYLEIPLVMHNVRVRLATPQSLYALRDRLKLNPGFMSNWLEKWSWKEVIHITCSEGEYFVAAGFADIHVGASIHLESLEWVKQAIQYCGVDPAAEEFWERENE